MSIHDNAIDSIEAARHPGLASHDNENNIPVMRHNINLAFKNVSIWHMVPKEQAKVPNIFTPISNVFKSIFKRDQQRFYRIKDMEGTIKPGTMTLVIGAPGHGKSTYLKVLGSRLKLNSGIVLANGRTAEEALREGCDIHKTNTYVDQVDIHDPYITVYQTLKFACQMTGQDMIEQRVNNVLDILQLQECRDTILGDASTRGVSGGQRRRVSIGEAMVSPSSLLLLDEFTNGLDSAVAEHLCTYLSQWCRTTGGSIVATIQQPTVAAFNAFDNVVVLRENRIIYDGPRHDLLSYFEAMGYPCPMDVDTCDFLLDVLTQPRLARRRLVENDKYKRSNNPEPNLFTERPPESPCGIAAKGDNHEEGVVDCNNNHSIDGGIDNNDRNEGIYDDIATIPVAEPSLTSSSSSRRDSPRDGNNDDDQDDDDDMKYNNHDEMKDQYDPLPTEPAGITTQQHHHSSSQGDLLSRQGSSTALIQQSSSILPSSPQNINHINHYNDDSSSPLPTLAPITAVGAATSSNIGAPSYYNPISTHTMMTSYGSLEPSPHPCFDTEQMVTFFRSTEFYRRVQADIKTAFGPRYSSILDNDGDNTTPITETSTDDTLHSKKTKKSSTKNSSPVNAIELGTVPEEEHNNHDGTCSNDVQSSSSPLPPSSSLFNHHPPLLTKHNSHVHRVGRSISFIDMFTFLLFRQYQAVYKNHTLIISRVIYAIVMSFINAGLYYQLSTQLYLVRVVGLCEHVVELAFLNLVEVAVACTAIPIVQKHLSQRYYPTGFYTAAVSIVALPYTAFETMLASLIVYWMIGHNPSVFSFFVYYFLLVAQSFAVSSLFRATAIAMRDIGRTTAALNSILLILSTANGVYLRTETMPVFLRWIYWVSPFSSTINAILKNEFSGTRYDQIVAYTTSGEPIRRGALFLEHLGMRQSDFWVFYAALYTIILALIANIISAYFLNDPYHEASRGTQQTAGDSDDIDNDILAQYDIKQSAVSTAANQTTVDRLSASGGSGGSGGGTIPLAHENPITGEIANSVVSFNQNIIVNTYEPSRSSTISATLTYGSTGGLPHFLTTGVNGNACANQPTTPTSIPQTDTDKSISLYTLTQELPFMPAVISFQDIKYTVKVKDPNDPKGGIIDRLLLRGVNGYAEPGKLVALMGSSGAGKTTLLDVLSGRKNTGVVEGTILINGQPATQKLFSYTSAYVEQQNILYPYDTVYETLYFAARLRLPSYVTHDVLHKVVLEVISILDLVPIQHFIVGNDEYRTLSPSQLKRVSIGVELVANPAILFLDEPTTGLDSKSAQTVMRAIKRIALSGRAIICTIHQPSAELFYLCDHLLLMSSGGYQTYFGRLGRRSRYLIQYLQDIPCIDNIIARSNPASWMVYETTKPLPLDIRIMMYNVMDAYYKNNNIDRQHVKVMAHSGQQLIALPSSSSSPMTQTTTSDRQQIEQPSDTTTPATQSPPFIQHRAYIVPFFNSLQDGQWEQATPQQQLVLWIRFYYTQSISSQECLKRLSLYSELSTILQKQDRLPTGQLSAQQVPSRQITIPEGEFVYKEDYDGDDHADDDTTTNNAPCHTANTCDNNNTTTYDNNNNIDDNNNNNNNEQEDPTIYRINTHSRLPWYYQISYLFPRLWHHYSRNPIMFLSRVFSIITLFLVYGLLYWQLEIKNEATILSRLSSTVTFIGNTGVTFGTVLVPLLGVLRMVYYRETISGYYTKWIYIPCLLLLEMIWICITFIVAWPTYAMVGLESDASLFFQWVLVLYIASLLTSSVALVVSHLLPDIHLAEVVFAFYISLEFAFTGIGMTKGKIKNGFFMFLFNILPFSHVLESVIMPQHENNYNTIEVLSTLADDSTIIRIVTIRDYISEYTGFNYGNYGQQIGWLFLMIAIFTIIAWLSSVYLLHIKR